MFKPEVLENLIKDIIRYCNLPLEAKHTLKNLIKNAETHNRMSNPGSKDMSGIYVESIVSQEVGTGIVKFIWGENEFQLSANEARDFAIRVLETSEASESDAFLLAFLQKTINIQLGEAGLILSQFREYREERKIKDYLPRKKEE